MKSLQQGIFQKCSFGKKSFIHISILHFYTKKAKHTDKDVQPWVENYIKQFKRSGDPANSLDTTSTFSYKSWNLALLFTMHGGP